MQALDFSLSKKSESAIHIAQALAKEFSNEEYNAAHLLKALLHKEIELRPFLDQIDADFYYMEEWCEVRIEALQRSVKIPDTIKGDRSVEAVFNEADSVKVKLGEDQISPNALLIALCTPGVGFSYEQLKTLPVKSDELLTAMNRGGGSRPANSASVKGGSISGSGSGPLDLKVLDEYCFDKTMDAKNQALEAVFGREAEVKTIVEILGRHSKPNVIITGEPGVGKTVLLDGFSEAVVNGNVPEGLADAQIYQLDLIHLVSGASYKSEVEDRFKKIFTALKQFAKPILLIDEIYHLTDKSNQNQGLVNILQSELAKGEVTIIATATNDSYRKHIEKEEGLARRFEMVSLDEPSEGEALKMISNTIDKYSDHHKLKIDKETIAEAIRLSKRFNKDRSLPDSAIDLIDRTMSASRYMVETTAEQVAKVQEQIQEIKDSKSSPEEKLEEATWLYNNLQNKFSYLLFAELDEENIWAGIEDAEQGLAQITSILLKFVEKASQNKDEIDKNDVSSTISNKTGIPVGSLQADEKERLLKMEEHMMKRVIGQDHAIEVISSSILESRSGLSKPGLPIGSFFFSGPTGTGKTELAKTLAEFLFQTEDSILRFDMSEFKEEHSAALLYGAPPGYVGYEEGGLLVNKIRQKPYSIVLFDEIEKAHPSVFDIFLQILDEGTLNDRLGKTGDFSNAVILFTSNIGSQSIVDSFGKGEIPKSSELLEQMGRHFRPEFLGRLTEIIPFAPITKENVVKIFNISLKDLHKALNKQEITLELSEKAQQFLAYKGYTPKYGARPLRGVIRTDLRAPLSKMLITGKISKGAKVSVDVKDDKLEWKYDN